MTLTEIRNAVITRMTAQTAIAKSDVTYPNGPTFDPTGKSIWARFTNVSGQAGANEIGAGPVVHRTGVLIIQLFVPVGSGSLLISQTADQLTQLFEFQDDGRLSYFAVSAIPAGETDGWSQLNLQIPYRAL
ncbi:phage tail terminator-like protein [Citrobacter koseri]|uniref:phage tail terminator-like protein n=1 Tax=Citrobacter koseri TaxID=545 RepID=UPI0028BD1731|nr:phage tail terminator-like protein [Citrobacter koseri]MDT7451264.1 phage tail terminator-like protein [Citrobacter koseri]